MSRLLRAWPTVSPRGGRGGRSIVVPGQIGMIAQFPAFALLSTYQFK